MLDIKQIVANPEEVKKRLSLRKPELAAQIDEVLEKYASYKTVLAKVEELRAKRNEMSKSIGKIKKEQGDEAAKQAMSEVGKLKEEMAAKEAEMEPLKAEIDNLLLSIPNMPNEKIPVGVSDADNPEYIPCSIPPVRPRRYRGAGRGQELYSYPKEARQQHGYFRALFLRIFPQAFQHWDLHSQHGSLLRQAS